MIQENQMLVDNAKHHIVEPIINALNINFEKIAAILNKNNELLQSIYTTRASNLSTGDNGVAVQNRESCSFPKVEIESLKEQGASDNEEDEKENSNQKSLASEIYCSDCKGTFQKGDGTFTAHLKAVGCKPHACPKCDKRFKKKYAAVQHEQMVHSTEEIPCNYPGCKLVVNNPKKLERHQLNIHGISGLLLPSLSCNKSNAKRSINIEEDDNVTQASTSVKKLKIVKLESE